MTEVRCARVKLKPGTTDQARAWAHTINTRKSEALATLKDEGVTVESVFLESTPEGEFLIYYMRAENFDSADAKVKRSSHDIDEFHQKFKRDTWQETSALELLVDLER